MTMNLAFVGAMVLLLVSVLVKLMMMIPLPKAQRKHTGQSLVEDSTIVDDEKASKRLRMMKNKKKQRLIVCKPRSHGVRFKPNFEKKQSENEPKLVYMAYIDGSSTLVLFSNLYHTFKSKTHQDSTAADAAAAMPTPLFSMEHPEGIERKCLDTPLYCKGLFVLPTANIILVCNPATKEVISLPQSTNKHAPRPFLLENEGLNLRVGFGFAPSTQAYKVAQFFYRSLDTTSKRYSMGFEVFTLGISKSWRVLAHDPPYPIYKSCFDFTGKCIYFSIWHLLDPDAPNGFLCFNLTKERFSVLYPPHYLKHNDVANMKLTNLQNKLCLYFSSANHTKVHLFTSKQGNNLDWMHTFSINVLLPSKSLPFWPVMQYAGQLLILLNDKGEKRLLIYHTNSNGSLEEVNGELEDANMQKMGISLIRNKPWFYVSRYEESLFKLLS